MPKSGPTGKLNAAASGSKPAGKPNKANRPGSKSNDKITPTQAKILATITTKPNLTRREIAAICDTDQSYVTQVMQKYGLAGNTVNDYISNRAMLLAGLQERIIASITDADIKSASLMQRLSAYGIAYDKERVERGLSDSSTKPMIQVNICNTVPQAGIVQVADPLPAPNSIPVMSTTSISMQDNEDNIHDV